MPRTLAIVVLAALVCAGATACTTTSQGTPSGQSGSASTSGDSGRPSIVLPPRPRDLSVTGLDPCNLFTSGQLTHLGIDTQPDSRTSTDSTHAPTCSLSVEHTKPYHDFDVRLIGEDVQAWVTERRNVDVWVPSSPVAGFPTVQTKTLGTSQSDCATAVGVAAAQQIEVFMTNTGDRAYTQDQLCQMTQQVAELAMQTLQMMR